MESPDDQFKINLNQNLWGLVVGLTALGLAEYYRLSVLFWFAAVVSGLMALSLSVTTVVYTIRYWKNKMR